jgi:hypothetical protein
LLDNFFTVLDFYLLFANFLTTFFKKMKILDNFWTTFWQFL